jgi:inositol-pentakisphosphate 2-kinase
LKCLLTGAFSLGYLLRVAKVRTLGQPLTFDYQFQNGFFTKFIKPVFGEYAIHHELVHIAKSGIVKELNAYLLKNEHLRKPKFRGSYVGETPLGFLVEDMRPPGESRSVDDITNGIDDSHIAGSDIVLVEFKPKWLSQSRSAPKNAVRCRQCALELQRFILDSPADMASRKDKPCPLSLANETPWQINSPYRIAPRLAEVDTERRWARELQAVIDHDIIHLLRRQQDAYDCHGPLHASASDMRLALAMTLRDCTCFVQLSPKGGDVPVKIRLGDFDWKASESKFKHWRDTEARLIDGGFYTAGIILCGQRAFDPPSACALAWTLSEVASGNDIAILLRDKGATATAEAQHGRLVGKVSTTYTHVVDATALQTRMDRYESSRLITAGQAQGDS